MEKDTFNDERDLDIEANRLAIQAILSGLFDNKIRFENTGFDGEYRPEFVYSIDENHKYEHESVGNDMITLIVCRRTGGHFDFKNKKCIHPREK